MNDKEKIKVLLVDDHEMVRYGLETYIRLSDDLELVGEAADGEEAVHVCDQLHPDIILMDMIMPRMNGVEATGLFTNVTLRLASLPLPVLRMNIWFNLPSRQAPPVTCKRTSP